MELEAGRSLDADELTAEVEVEMSLWRALWSRRVQELQSTSWLLQNLLQSYGVSPTHCLQLSESRASGERDLVSEAWRNIVYAGETDVSPERSAAAKAARLAAEAALPPPTPITYVHDERVTRCDTPAEAQAMASEGK